MRDTIADIIDEHDGEMTCYVLADLIMDALPDMIAPLVWEDNGADGLEARGYSIDEGPNDNVVLYPPYGDGVVFKSEDEAKAAANAHHVAQIMAAFIK
jgi:hypothetical protein